MHFDSVNYSGKKKSPTSYFLTLLLIKFLSNIIAYIINKLYMIIILDAKASPAMVIIIASLDIDQTKPFWNRFSCLKFIFGRMRTRQKNINKKLLQEVEYIKKQNKSFKITIIYQLIDGNPSGAEILQSYKVA